MTRAENAKAAGGRRRAAARQRALSRLAQEHMERYRQLYQEELAKP